MSRRLSDSRITAAPRTGSASPKRWSAVGRALLVGLLLSATGSTTCAGEIDLPMHVDPAVEIPSPIKTLPAGQIELWQEGLRHTEADLQYRIALDIARARRMGIDALEPLIDPLIECVSREESHPLVRAACVHALVELDARRAAGVLFTLTERGDSNLAPLIEPALGRWEDPSIRAVWQKRLAGDKSLPRGALRLAIEGLRQFPEPETSREPGTAEQLRGWALDRAASPEIRLSAAQALAVRHPESLAPDARQLLSSQSTPRRVDRLVAVTLLVGERGRSADALLAELAGDSEPAVALVAWKRLLEIDPRLVVELAERSIDHRDGSIRQLAARTLLALPTMARIERLWPLLRDPLPGVRRQVCQELTTLGAQAPFSEAVRRGGMQLLAGDDPRGIEQAIFLLVGLDHQPAAERLLECLEFRHPDVFVTAAWGLRRLAVPATLPQLLEWGKRSAMALRGWPANTPGAAELDAGLCQVFQMFGQMNYPPAAELLREFVPKIQPGIDSQSRLAAIWALGHIFAEEPPAELVALLEERLIEEGELPPETPQARRMAAISLGRMRARGALDSLRRSYGQESPNALLGRACGWSIERMTGEKLPPAVPLRIEQGGWTLMKLR